MKPWEVWTWKFPDAGEHPVLVLGTDERVRLKPRVCVILCSTQWAARKPEVQARELLKVPNEVTRGLTHFTTDPRLMLAHRDRVARMIERLQRSR